ncbi:uncharacterized protein MONOS_13822 [Monocercomonoides exilis]|uniref:uncharacterized protein n=1 Tax=Monocercomonoides exilis TaxID=2049356 RepID=UPI003559B1A0|nr:hypothetical protein MONOS_13822 [Monocercomonoides exilis]|eukprot:MONOS_13822.1-p1 / transcript=MONOS_13822.1 / gene=MONOS_13822 / organism=Monocercomonoides_exilis_PA203 / gene_product=unspecified product / transcript_product=unspecified product / location=Mono_scaffold00889:21132-22704(-) / protein_length=394 / sequence_SO=supercontig / SO=protein_coding / is_pseudo=false
MEGGWRCVGRRALIVFIKEMEMGRGAVGAATMSLLPVVVVGVGVVTLGEMGMKNFNREVTRAMQDEFQNENGKVDDEEAKITCNSLESNDQREKLLCTPTNQKENKMASEAQQEAKESQTPILTRERKLDCMRNDLFYSELEDLSDELDVFCRYVRIKSEENVQFVWKMRKVPVFAVADTRQTRAILDLMSALKSGLKLSQAELRRESRSDTQEGKERNRERITFDFLNIQQQSFPSIRTSLSPSLISQAVHPSSASTPPAIRPLALEGGKSPSTPNKLHLSSSEQIAFDPLDAVNQVKEHVRKTELKRKKVPPKEQTGNLPIENVNKSAVVQKRPLISDALLPRSSSRHSFPVYPVPSQQQATAKKKKAALMLSQKPQRLRREMWLGELIKK